MLVVGGGPIGLMGSLLLSRLDVRSLVVDLRFDTTAQGLSQDDGGVSCTIRDNRTGRATPVSTKFAIGADGLRSSTRAAIRQHPPEPLRLLAGTHAAGLPMVGDDAVRPHEDDLPVFVGRSGADFRQAFGPDGEPARRDSRIEIGARLAP